MPVKASGLQLVGLNVKFGRFASIRRLLICEGTPLTRSGSGSLVNVATAVFSSTVIVDITGILPRLKGAVPMCSASLSASTPNGAPL